jgi:hypothetical protein
MFFEVVKRARQKGEAPPAMPMNVVQLQLSEYYQTYKRSEGREERFLLADSVVYEENSQMHRFIKGFVDLKLKYLGF